MPGDPPDLMRLAYEAQGKKWPYADAKERAAERERLRDQVVEVARKWRGTFFIVADVNAEVALAEAVDAYEAWERAQGLERK